MREEIFDRVVETVGTQAELRRRINALLHPSRPLSAQAVSKWRSVGIPAERVLQVERAVEGKVTRYEMRPDIFGARQVEAA